MAIIKCVDRDYSSNNTNYNDVDITVLKYISQSEKAVENLLFGFNVLLSYPEFMAQQFKTVRKIFHKEEGRLLRHFIVSYSEKDNINLRRAFDIAIIIATYYASDYQIVFAVHADTEHIHTHFIINTVSFVDGHKFSEGYEDFNQFLCYVKAQCPGLNFEAASKTDII